jgi:chitin disaccharide deacetylase
MEELEMELRAQIERVLHSGLKVDYVDFHMGTATRNPEFRRVTEKVAEDYGLGMSGFFGENMISPQYWAEPGAKLDSLITMLDELEPGYNTVIVHVGEDTPEMAALVDMNQDNPLPG